MDDPAGVYFHLCPRCGRAVPRTAAERYCINDGTPMLTGCPVCGAGLTSPYSRYCGHCGHGLVVGPDTGETDAGEREARRKTATPLESGGSP